MLRLDEVTTCILVCWIVASPHAYLLMCSLSWTGGTHTLAAYCSLCADTLSQTQNGRMGGLLNISHSLADHLQFGKGIGVQRGQDMRKRRDSKQKPYEKKPH